MTERQPNRVAYGRAIAEIGARDARVVVLDADISKSTNTFHFARRFPERFFNMGTAEQNLISFSAGLATTGKIPFASTFAVFASLRAGEQIRSSVAYPKLNVKIVATNAGVEICGDGPTHQACEDLAVMRALPNLLVLSPADPVTTVKATGAIYRHVGPVYMRLGRQEAAVLHTDDTPFEIGRMIPLRDGADVTLIATGNMVEQALLAAEGLARRGISARVLDCHTVKPIDAAAIRRAARETGAIVTAEDHNVYGGLGSAVCEVVAEMDPSEGRLARVVRVGLQDRFASSGRDYRALLSHFGLDAATIARRAEEALGRS
jgi:transketolase